MPRICSTLKSTRYWQAGWNHCLDAHVILHPASVSDAMLPRRRFVLSNPIRFQLASKVRTQFTVRPIRPDDESLMVDFHHQLSEMSNLHGFFPP